MTSIFVAITTDSDNQGKLTENPHSKEGPESTTT